MQEFYVCSALDFHLSKKNKLVYQAFEDTQESKELCLLSPVGSCVMVALHYL